MPRGTEGGTAGSAKEDVVGVQVAARHPSHAPPPINKHALVPRLSRAPRYDALSYLIIFVSPCATTPRAQSLAPFVDSAPAKVTRAQSRNTAHEVARPLQFAFRSVFYQVRRRAMIGQSQNPAEDSAH